MKKLIAWERITILCMALLSMTACGGNDSAPQSPPPLSKGLKIFATSSLHVGDFANDGTLAGTTATEKADSFCNADANKPNDSVYKALIVDGVNRDAITPLDWVLQANTIYYRSYGDVEIGKTTSSAIFTLPYKDLSISIADKRVDNMQGLDSPNTAWTGIQDVNNLAVGETCNNWSAYSSSGSMGFIYELDSTSLSVNLLVECKSKRALYCVEQP